MTTVHDNVTDPARRASHPLAVLDEAGVPLWCAVGGGHVWERVTSWCEENGDRYLPAPEQEAILLAAQHEQRKAA